MAIDYKNPYEVGADRIANAIAAREAFGTPVIVLDLRYSHHFRYRLTTGSLRRWPDYSRHGDITRGTL